LLRENGQSGLPGTPATSPSWGFAGYDLMCEPNSNAILDIWDPEEFQAQYGGTGGKQCQQEQSQDFFH